MRSDTGKFEPWKLTLSLEELEELETEAEYYGLADVMNFGGHLRRAEEAALARLGLVWLLQEVCIASLLM